jgi:hypothetical protein
MNSATSELSAAGCAPRPRFVFAHRIRVWPTRGHRLAKDVRLRKGEVELNGAVRVPLD